MRMKLFFRDLLLLMYLSTLIQGVLGQHCELSSACASLPRPYSDIHVVYRAIDEQTNRKLLKDRIGMAVSKF
jgi:hypothetical protein